MFQPNALQDEMLRNYINTVFDRFDTDRNGTLDVHEMTLFFNDLFRTLKINMTVTERDSMEAIRSIDENSDGVVSKQELYLAFKKMIDQGSNVPNQGNNGQYYNTNGNYGQANNGQYSNQFGNQSYGSNPYGNPYMTNYSPNWNGNYQQQQTYYNPNPPNYMNSKGGPYLDSMGMYPNRFNQNYPINQNMYQSQGQRFYGQNNPYGQPYNNYNFQR